MADFKIANVLITSQRKMTKTLEIQGFNSMTKPTRAKLPGVLFDASIQIVSNQILKGLKNGRRTICRFDDWPNGLTLKSQL